MPTFRVRNLSISLGEDVAPPEPQGCLLIRQSLQPWTICYDLCSNCNDYSIPLTNCGPYWSTQRLIAVPDDWCGGTMSPVIERVEDPVILEQLQGQVQVVMEAIEKRGVELQNAFQPQSVEQVEQLEQELEAALAELREMKDSM